MNDRARKAPFPWFGGKSTVADYVWRRLERLRIADAARAAGGRR